MVIESFTGVRSGNLLSLRSAMLACLSAPWREYQVAGHQYADRRSGTDRDGWLNVEIALRDLVASARRVRLGCPPARLAEERKRAVEGKSVSLRLAPGGTR